jgi:hypothetical protein
VEGGGGSVSQERIAAAVIASAASAPATAEAFSSGLRHQRADTDPGRRRCRRRRRRRRLRRRPLLPPAAINGKMAAAVLARIRTAGRTARRLALQVRSHLSLAPDHSLIPDSEVHKLGVPCKRCALEESCSFRPGTPSAGRGKARPQRPAQQDKPGAQSPVCDPYRPSLLASCLQSCSSNTLSPCGEEITVSLPVRKDGASFVSCPALPPGRSNPALGDLRAHLLPGETAPGTPCSISTVGRGGPHLRSEVASFQETSGPTAPSLRRREPLRARLQYLQLVIFCQNVF